MNIKSLVLGLAVAASLGSPANANLILNGSLENSTYGLNNTVDNSVAILNNATGLITSWTVGGSAANPTRWNTVYINDAVLGGPPPPFMPASYYIPSKGAPTGFTGAPTGAIFNPDGPGHFINLDGDKGNPNVPSDLGFQGAISQMIPIGGPKGLVVNQQYELTFSWAAVQRANEIGGTYDLFLEVLLGNSQLFATPRIGTAPQGGGQLPEQGFSGWYTESIAFTYTGGSGVLKFLANGQPFGNPPSINLDGISLNPVPEPPMWALLIAAGFGLVGVNARRRRQTVVAD